MEWGAPRVPILTTVGMPNLHLPPPPSNPRPEWSKSVLDQVKDGKLKRIKYWDNKESDTTITTSGSTTAPSQPTPEAFLGPDVHEPSVKRVRLDLDKSVSGGEAVQQGEEMSAVPDPAEVQESCDVVVGNSVHDD